MGRVGSILCCLMWLLGIVFFTECWARDGQWQQPKPIQTPRDVWQKPGDIQKPGNIEKLVDQSGCHITLMASSDALFEFNQSRLSPAADDTLQKAQQSILEQKIIGLRIRGHTDALGSDAYNQQLSRARAQAVREWLTSHLAMPPPMSIEALGKSEPIVPNKHSDGTDDPEGRARNRRVEIVLERCHANTTTIER